jgi:hypothetical protein
MKGINMKFRIFTLLFAVHALICSAKVDDNLYLYLECRQRPECIEFIGEDGSKESGLPTPALVLTKDNVQSANIASDAPHSLTINLDKEAAAKFEKITGEHIGDKLLVVLNNKLLTAPVINSIITGGSFAIGGGVNPQKHFWENNPWLKAFVDNSYRNSYRTECRTILNLAIAEATILIAASIFVLWPWLRRKRDLERSTS